MINLNIHKVGRVVLALFLTTVLVQPVPSAYAADTTPTAISAVRSVNVASTSATIIWTTDEVSTSIVECGNTINYGKSSALANLVTNHTITLSGLTANTPYYYRVRSKDAAGNLATSANFTFTTTAGLFLPDNTPPVISRVAASGLTSTGATITWTTDEASDSQVEYGTTTAYGLSSILDTTKVTSHFVALGSFSGRFLATDSLSSLRIFALGSLLSRFVALDSLSPNTLYHYRVKSKDAAGNLATSADFTFTTASAPDTTSPVISGVGANGITSSGATITWTTNEASDTQVEY